MGRIQGLHSMSTLDFSVVSKFYIFQVQLCSGVWPQYNEMQEALKILCLPLIAWQSLH
jgi:hypothetical protein